MKKKNLFASMAGKALALAVAVMMSVAFTACSGDDPVTFTNTITLDGKMHNVTTAELSFFKNGSYWLMLQFSDYTAVVAGVPEFHNGKTFDMAKKPDGCSGLSWSVAVMKAQKFIFSGDGSDNPNFVFSAGTLKTNVDKATGEAEVTLVDGRITTESEYFGDGKPHTISISWKGKAKS